MHLKNLIKKIINILKKKRYIPIVEVKDKEKILENKVALITGGSSGIGYAIAEIFLKHGCKVIITGTKREKLEKCCEKLKEWGECEYIVLNVLDIKNMYNKIIECASVFKENRIDILVNSAGVVAKTGFKEINEEEYDLIMNTNLKGTYFMSKFVSEFMINKKIRGHILNISSSSSLRPAWTPYQLSKWGIRGFTLGLADNLIKYGIIVNAIAPGPTATPMLNKFDTTEIYYQDTPAKRFSMPVEIANTALFLVSGTGDMIVGDTIYVTGGSGVITLHH